MFFPFCLIFTKSSPILLADLTWSARDMEKREDRTMIWSCQRSCEEEGKAMPKVIDFKRPRLFALGTFLLIFKPWSSMRLYLIAATPKLRGPLLSLKRVPKGKLILFTPRWHRAKTVLVNSQRLHERVDIADERICLP